MKLLGAWDAGPYLYQVWETEEEYLCLCIDARTLESVCEGAGNTPMEAITEGVREALRALS